MRRGVRARKCACVLSGKVFCVQEEEEELQNKTKFESNLNKGATQIWTFCEMTAFLFDCHDCALKSVSDPRRSNPHATYRSESEIVLLSEISFQFPGFFCCGHLLLLLLLSFSFSTLLRMCLPLFLSSFSLNLLLPSSSTFFLSLLSPSSAFSSFCEWRQESHSSSLRFLITSLSVASVPAF